MKLKKRKSPSPPERILKLVREYRRTVPLHLRDFSFKRFESSSDPSLFRMRFGLCAVIYPIYSTKCEEISELLDYVKTHRPKGLSNNSEDIVSKSRFYWPPGDWEARVAWLKERIKIENKLK